MADESQESNFKSSGYELFILLLSLVSIFNLAIEFIGPMASLPEPIIDVIRIINIILTFFFLTDFIYRFFTAKSKSQYFLKDWGWTDLLACIPTFRIFRLFRVVKAIRLLKRFGPQHLITEISQNRADSSLYLAVFGIILVAEIAGLVVLSFESIQPDGNIETAWDAVWWVLVTLTTVGYGDLYPVSIIGRITAVFVMFSGVALIGVLASYLASFFMESPKQHSTNALANTPQAKLAELQALLAEQQATQEQLIAKIKELEQML